MKLIVQAFDDGFARFLRLSVEEYIDITENKLTAKEIECLIPFMDTGEPVPFAHKRLILTLYGKHRKTPRIEERNKRSLWLKFQM